MDYIAPGCAHASSEVAWDAILVLTPTLIITIIVSVTMTNSMIIFTAIISTSTTRIAIIDITTTSVAPKRSPQTTFPLVLTLRGLHKLPHN